MQISPGLVQSPAGWKSAITHDSASDRYVDDVQYQQLPAAVALAGASSIDPSFETASSLVYLAGPEQDPGFNFAVAPACFRAGTLI